MKKLFLAVSICASILASSPVWAVETVAKIEDSARAQRKIAEAAALSWAKDVARDMQLSADPLARAMADLSLRFWAAQENQEVLTSQLSTAQKVALYSAKTPVPERILYLLAACVGYGNQDALCGDAKLTDALTAADAKNAFTVLLAESIRDSAETQALERAENAEPQITDYDEFVKAQTVKSSARLLPKLSASNAYYDYAQAFKTPILIAVKRRPPPSEVLARLPTEVSALAAAFAPEEIAAEMFVNALISTINANYRQISACAASQSTELKAECARIADLILANPKNSAASAKVALNASKNHPYTKRLEAFFSGSNQKVFDPINLLKLDWLALRSVLNKAATQGDVAAIPDALAWADQAYAKIPNKSAEVIAAEAKASADEQAQWKAQRAVEAAENAANLKREAGNAPATEAKISEVQQAKWEAQRAVEAAKNAVNLKHAAGNAPATPSAGKSADRD